MTKPFKKQRCLHCGHWFPVRKPWARFCSAACRVRNWMEQLQEDAAVTRRVKK